MKLNINFHAIIFDGTSYYVVSIVEAKEIVKNDPNCAIIKEGSDLDLLSDIADTLNKEL